MNNLICHKLKESYKTFSLQDITKMDNVRIVHNFSEYYLSIAYCF